MITDLQQLLDFSIWGFEALWFLATFFRAILMAPGPSKVVGSHNFTPQNVALRAINMARKNVARKNLSASKPQIEISRSCWRSMIIYYPHFRLKKAQKHTQQQTNVVAGKNLRYGWLFTGWQVGIIWLTGRDHLADRYRLAGRDHLAGM